jgi:hypothetical protein
MGKPMGRHPLNPNTQNPSEPLDGSTKQVRSHDLSSTWVLHLRPACLSKKWSNSTNVSSKLGRGPTSPQHSPVTHLESLRYWKHYFEGLELSSSCLDLRLHLSLLLNKLLDQLLCNRPFQALFHCHNHLV